jgi:hypothetical protein
MHRGDPGVLEQVGQGDRPLVAGIFSACRTRKMVETASSPCAPESDRKARTIGVTRIMSSGRNCDVRMGISTSI